MKIEVIVYIVKLHMENHVILVIKINVYLVKTLNIDYLVVL